MDVVFVPSATRDLEEVAEWWEANRFDAPGLVSAELRDGVERLRRDGARLPVFRRIGELAIRRLHLPRTHRHLYYHVAGERVVVLAVWGSVRGVLPRLRARVGEDA